MPTPSSLRASPPLAAALPSAALALLTLLSGCSVTQPVAGAPAAPATEHPVATQATATRRNVDVAALHELLGDPSIALIDVRTPGEFAQEHMPGARNIPLDTLPQALDELRSMQAEIYLACRSGNRSGTAADLLVRNGISATNVRGGMNAWQAAGYPVE